jgi:hypothetical protein
VPSFLVLLLPALLLLWGLVAFIRGRTRPSDEQVLTDQARLDAQTLAAGAFLYHGSGHGGDGLYAHSGDGGYSGGDSGGAGAGDGGGGGSW